MSAKEIRAQAREALQGKWGAAIAIMLLYGAVTGVITFVSSLLGAIPIIGWLISLGISICMLPLAYGYLMNVINIKRGETESVVEFFKYTIDNFKRAWAVTWYTFVKLIGWFAIYFGCAVAGGIAIGIGTAALVAEVYAGGVIAMILGIAVIIIGICVLIVKAYLYSMTEYHAIYNPELAAKDAVVNSAELMKGNRWRLFCLELSFIGWAFLSLFTCGIGYLFLAPYMAFANICFYEDLAKVEKKETVVAAAEPVVEQAQPVAEQPQATPVAEEPVAPVIDINE